MPTTNPEVPRPRAHELEIRLRELALCGFSELFMRLGPLIEDSVGHASLTVIPKKVSTSEKESAEPVRPRGYEMEKPSQAHVAPDSRGHCGGVPFVRPQVVIETHLSLLPPRSVRS
jgi:hypothetical protein